MALDGIMFEGVSVRVRRPNDYNPAAAATLGPSVPNANLNLSAIGLQAGGQPGVSVAGGWADRQTGIRLQAGGQPGVSVASRQTDGQTERSCGGLALLPIHPLVGFLFEASAFSRGHRRQRAHLRGWPAVLSVRRPVQGAARLLRRHQELRPRQGPGDGQFQGVRLCLTKGCGVGGHVQWLEPSPCRDARVLAAQLCLLQRITEINGSPPVLCFM
jgi:hypothetical protein